MKENKVLFYILSFTWSLLWTLIGLFVALFIFIFMRKQVEFSNEHGRLRINYPNRNFGGASLGVVIITSGNFDFRSLINHELGHTIQSAYMGIFFIPFVAIPSWVRYQMDIRGKLKRDYYAAWFERQATELGDFYFGRK